MNINNIGAISHIKIKMFIMCHIRSPRPLLELLFLDLASREMRLFQKRKFPKKTGCREFNRYSGFRGYQNNAPIV